VKDGEFYQQVPGLQSPRKVEQVELDMSAKRVVVHVGVEPGTRWDDLVAHAAAHVHQWRQRTWRYLDTCQFETGISARPMKKWSQATEVSNLVCMPKFQNYLAAGPVGDRCV
jgi:hypothetical protein